MRIDSHQHFWKYDPAEYGWIQPDWPIRRDYLPADLLPELHSSKLDGCIAVQARQSLEESRWLLELADQSPCIKGVVGWVDLRSADVAAQLEMFAKHSKFVGVRHVVQDEPDDSFMLGREFLHGIGLLKSFKLTYDILIYPRQLPAAIELVKQFPEQPFVLDHIAKPSIKTRAMAPWDRQIRELAKHQNVFCKISGMATEADWNSWLPSDVRPYLDVVFEAFGVERLMYGSDWPVALLAGSYRQTYDLAHEYVAGLGISAERAIFGVNAEHFYLTKQ